MTQQEPLVYTTKGNMPASQLRVEPCWTDTPDYVKVAVRHIEIATGELVREDCYALAKRPLLAQPSIQL